MKDELKHLQALREKIDATWNMLNVGGMIAEMHGCEAEMQSPDFWSDQNNAKAVGQVDDYRDLFMEKFNPTFPVKAVIITDRIHPNIIKFAQKHEVELWQV